VLAGRAAVATIAQLTILLGWLGLAIGGLGAMTVLGPRGPNGRVRRVVVGGRTDGL
jgi:hypothetical protein